MPLFRGHFMGTAWLAAPSCCKVSRCFCGVVAFQPAASGCGLVELKVAGKSSREPAAGVAAGKTHLQTLPTGSCHIHGWIAMGPAVNKQVA